MVSISLTASGDATFAILYVFCGGNDHTSTGDGMFTILYVLGTILVTASGDAIVSILFVLGGGYSTASGDAIVRQYQLDVMVGIGMLVEGSHEPINHEGVTTLQNFLAMCLEYNVM